MQKKSFWISSVERKVDIRFENIDGSASTDFWRGHLTSSPPVPTTIVAPRFRTFSEDLHCDLVLHCIAQDRGDDRLRWDAGSGTLLAIQNGGGQAALPCSFSPDYHDDDDDDEAKHHQNTSQHVNTWQSIAIVTGGDDDRKIDLVHNNVPVGISGKWLMSGTGLNLVTLQIVIDPKEL